ncbi:MAG: hypothetical protein KF767_01250 [Bdellovibrionaceae bacterium]|nr:hypothetical protein [Pseudobdellovibrionaceae bacterium]
MKLWMGLSLVLALGLTAGCSSEYDASLNLPSTDGDNNNLSEDPNENVLTPTPNPTPDDTPAFAYEPLSWESARSDSKPWSTYAFKVIREEAYDSLNKAIDADVFCPNYHNLSKDQRINFWGALISGITKFESGYNPTTRYHESTMGTDPITKQPVYSEGLLQLSYQDVQWAKYCEFDWSKDKNLKSTDPKKTIFDPYKNLRCGIKILAAQVNRTKEILLTSGVYWAVIREGGRYEKIDEIAVITKKLTFCKK